GIHIGGRRQRCAGFGDQGNRGYRRRPHGSLPAADKLILQTDLDRTREGPAKTAQALARSRMWYKIAPSRREEELGLEQRPCHDLLPSQALDGMRARWPIVLKERNLI